MRAVSYLKKPTDDWSLLRDYLDRITFYLVHRCPTVFSIRSENNEVFKVVLGNPHRCSCGLSLCIHIMFVIIKVLRVPDDNPLCWQPCLTDTEIDNILNGNIGTSKRKITNLRDKQSTKVSKETEIFENNVSRMPLEDDIENICPICQDELNKDQAMTWCRKGCGNNIHAKCMKMFAQFKISNNDGISCPLCREDWGPDALKLVLEDCKGKSSLKKSCATVKCHGCTLSVRGLFYRCIECSQMKPTLKSNELLCNNENDENIPITLNDYCKRCFDNIGREHIKHHFLESNADCLSISDFTWMPVRNPRAPARTVDSDLLRELQNRELTNADYDMLLGLDKSEQISLNSHIVNSLSNCSSHQKLCCFCNLEKSNINSNTIESEEICNTSSTSTILKEIPCGHVSHDTCLEDKIKDALAEEGYWMISKIICGVTNCKQIIFPGLSRQRKKKKGSVDSTQIPGANTENHKDSNINQYEANGLSILHIGIAGLRIGASNGVNNGNRQSSNGDTSVGVVTEVTQTVTSHHGLPRRPPRTRNPTQINVLNNVNDIQLIGNSRAGSLDSASLPPRNTNGTTIVVAGGTRGNRRSIPSKNITNSSGTHQPHIRVRSSLSADERDNNRNVSTSSDDIQSLRLGSFRQRDLTEDNLSNNTSIGKTGHLLIGGVSSRETRSLSASRIREDTSAILGNNVIIEGRSTSSLLRSNIQATDSGNKTEQKNEQIVNMPISNRVHHAIRGRANYRRSNESPTIATVSEVPLCLTVNHYHADGNK